MMWRYTAGKVVGAFVFLLWLTTSVSALRLSNALTAMEPGMFGMRVELFGVVVVAKRQWLFVYISRGSYMFWFVTAAGLSGPEDVEKMAKIKWEPDKVRL